MMPGPDFIYKCPNCEALIKNGSLFSGNTIGARLFSDGKTIAPMLPGYPDLTKCKKCNTIFWLSKLKEIEIDYFIGMRDSKWEKVKYASFLGISDCFKALKAEMAETKEEELIIRQEIWWAYNDRVRKGKEIFKDEKDELRWLGNANKLMALLDLSDTDQSVMIAEIKRNLGDFEGCINILNSFDNDQLDFLKEKLTNECNKKNRWVVQLY